ncbi:nucleoside-diphosphate sugar epimerase/dehydratase [Sinorhizobium sp. BG8]|uniref:polysaccharide biosynthesis protein n=1 Tax=Sinorhizobium sp. BG8 TaxID=2613773 RepID=UPI00193D5FE8|nr:nucleoside-diphosphate sugar epimerase/dehydratase [Sinorhizobium sp. BG8]
MVGVGRSSARKVQKSFGLYVTDILSAMLALIFAFVLRYGSDTIISRPELMRVLLVTGPQYLAICAIVFPLTGLYSRNWRYGSISDLFTIFRAVIVTTAMLVWVLFISTRLTAIPRSTILVEALLLTTFLVASRLSFRMDELPLKLEGFSQKRPGSGDGARVPTLLVGAGDAAELYLRALQRDRNCTHHPIACLDRTGDQQGMTLRGVPIVGSLSDFDEVIARFRQDNQLPRHVVFTEAPSVFGEEKAEELIKKAESLGMTVSRLSQMTELKNAKRENRFELRQIELTDLLERPQAALDKEAINRLVRGRRVLVTGAGGSIGSELTLQVAACEPAEIVLIENCEYNLYAIDMELNERFPNVPRSAHLCNIRRATRVNDIFDVHRPELVFHAAALKHVPMVELNPCEGALTNIIGTMNVATAAKRIGVKAMVQISTDKVVNPTSVMGATKRLAELFCQALDLQGLKEGTGPRFMTVRFGNVLGSSGSLIPLFKRQIANGGPLTVTDAQMTRFFMTIREAVELTLQASAYGLEGDIGQGEIFVLDMGEPIRIIDIARRMIRLAGFTPDEDIAIKIIGLRPGEKLYEELFDTHEQRVSSPVPGVLGAVPNPVELPILMQTFARLQLFAEIGDESMVLALISSLIPGYRKQAATAPVADTADETEVTISQDEYKVDAGNSLIEKLVSGRGPAPTANGLSIN